MSNKQKPDGCAIMMRRTFLFFVGLAGAKFLKEYFSLEENRSQFFQLVQQLRQKAVLAKNNQTSSSILEENIPSNPVIPPQTAPQEESLPNNPPVAPKTPSSSPSPSSKGKPVEVTQKTLNGISFYQTTIDLKDPETFITIALANNAPVANSARGSNGDESFDALVKRSQGAVVANGTFFSKDDEKRVMGNMVAGGRFLKYSRWENYGTTLGIRAGNQLEMVTAREEGQPDWEQHWFSLTCGPRLLKQGKIKVAPQGEGFQDPHVLDVGGRVAIGYPASGDKLFLVTFLSILSLEQEAELMQAIGCFEAMNLDGGASKALAHRGKILVPAGRLLTNVIVIYDTEHRAPEALKNSWHSFQQGERPVIPS